MTRQWNRITSIHQIVEIETANWIELLIVHADEFNVY